jgi:putative hemolysin
VVTGEDGRVEGIVTLNDVLEGLVGGMPEWSEIVAPGVVRAGGRLLAGGRAARLRAVRRLLRRQDPGAPEFATLHDFVLERLGGRPATAAVVRWRGLRLEIVDMDGAQIDKVLVMVEADGAAG